MSDSYPEPTGSWLDALGLRQDPFSAEHDAGFFYAEPAFMQRLDLLTHLAQFSDSLLVVLGDADAGKTTLAQQFCNHASDNWRLCVLRGEEIGGFDVLLQQLATCFGLGGRQQAPDLPDRLMDHCAGLREVMELPVLIIDDAHRVAPSVLRALAGLAGDPRQTVQQLRIILFGEPALEGLLAEAGLAPGLAPFVQTLTMPRFNEVQAAAYLMFRLTVAGYSGESPYSVTEVRAIAKSADGLPGRMNNLAREALMEQADRMKVISARGDGGRGAIIRRLLVVAIAGVLIATGWFWLQDSGEEASPEIKSPEGVAELPLALPPLSRIGTIEPRATGETELVTPLDAPVAVEPDIAVETPGIVTPPPPPEVEPAPVPPEPPVVAEAAVEAPAASSAPAQLPEKAPEAAAQPEAPAAAVESPVEAATEFAAPPVLPAAATPETAPVVAAPAVLQREDWIRAQAGTRYTLQLLGTRNEDSIRAFVRDHGLTGELAYYHRLHQGGDWYTLIYGSFRDRAAARAAVARLPRAVQRDKPWPRSFAAVQEQLPDNPR